MLKKDNVVIVGTSHIAKESVSEIEKVFSKENPDIVAVELDKNRLHSLLQNKKPDYSPRLIKIIGFKGYLFALIGGFLQQKLGSIVGIKPGSDMLRAVELARDNKKKVALIDRDVRITLARFSKSFSFKDKFNLFIDLFKSPFSKKMRIDLRRVPSKELIKKLMGIMKDRYPGLYGALVDERNQIMAKKISLITKNHPESKILVVLGAGHEEEVFNLISTKYI